MSPQIKDGTLAAALGWAGPLLIEIANANPKLAFQLLMIERVGLHTLAFVLATTDRPATPELIDIALTQSTREVLHHIGRPDLQGLRRVLDRIPDRILEGHHYQLIAQLLEEPKAAHVLHHASAVNPALLETLNALPRELRAKFIVDVIRDLPDAVPNLIQWIDIMVTRLEGASRHSIATTSADSRSLPDLRLRMSRLIDGLSGLEAAPPKMVGHATRVDSPSAIRQLGKLFKNCLNVFHDCDIDGGSFIYHWRSRRADAVCEVIRAGHLGWFLADHLGVNNAALDPSVAEAIQSSFAAVGIHSVKIVETFEAVYYSVRPPKFHIPRNEPAPRGRWRLLG